MFPPGKSRRKTSRETWGFEISRFPGNLYRDPGKFSHINKDFRGTDIHHSDMKNALVQILNSFLLTKIIFEKSKNFLKRKACEIKIFSSICQKN